MEMTVLQTFEQGMPRADGGVIKLFEGQKLQVVGTKQGMQVTVAGKTRNIPGDIMKKLMDAKLIKVE